MLEEAVTLEIAGGPTVKVDWAKGMTCQDLLESAYDGQSKNSFTYALQYYGEALGYLVVMINETYDSYISSAEPFFYWELLINDVPATKGIDNTLLSPGDNVTFQFERYIAEKHQDSTLHVKFQALSMGAKGAS